MVALRRRVSQALTTVAVGIRRCVSCAEGDPKSPVTETVQDGIQKYLSRVKLEDVEKSQQTVECPFCMEQVLELSVLKFCCDSLCRNCAFQHLTEQVGTMNAVLLDCPECEEILEPDFIPKMLGNFDNEIAAGLLESWEKHMIQKALATEEIIAHCPGDGCRFAMIIEDPKACPTAPCPVCEITFCVYCGVEHDCSQPCPDMEEIQLQGEIADECYLRKCPRCKIAIFKDEGCEAVECTRCKHYFCFTCGQPDPHHPGCER